ncbi:MAG: serine/threonine protein kinase [Myxococcota bacterium]|jgi:serine/threonine protein kinase
MLSPGQLVEHRYEIVRVLGSGAMASVYEVRHTSLHSRHALKVLNAELAGVPDLRSRFLAEGRIQAQLNHPNIVSVTDIVTDPVPGLVMEYIEGGNLDALLAKEGPREDPAEALALFLPIVAAVQVAHRAGVVHRDLKPENILIRRDDRGRAVPLVADFGIARVADVTDIIGDKRRTEVGMRMGTVLYMSPEQIAGQPVDARSDIFALGCILYEILTGEIAFDAPSEFVTMKRIVEGDLPQRAVGGLPDGVAACIRKALAVDPEERFNTALALAEALEGVVLHDAVPPSRPSRSQAVTRLPEPTEEIINAVPPRSLETVTTPAAGRPPPLPRSTPRLPAPRRSRPPAKPWAMPSLAAVLNLTVLLTGVGQLMNGQIGKAIVVAILHWTLALVTCFSSVPFTIVIAAVDAYVVGRKLNAGRQLGSWES